MLSDEVRVVVVDDNEDSAESMAAVLRFSGCEVLTANSAPAALELIASYRPHCVLFDIMMPVISGDELCGRLRALYGDDIVLIAVSGFSESDPQVDKGFALADHFFTKPVDPRLLTQLLHPRV